MIYRNEDIQEMIDDLDITKVVGEYVELRKQGENYKGLCPFHEEKTPSFSVSPTRGIFKCFGCNEAGNALQFYMKYNSLDYIQAVEELAEKYNYKLKKINPSQKMIKYNKEKEKLIEIIKEAEEFFSKNLFSEYGKESLQYLKKRGLSQEIIKEYSLGFALNSWEAMLEHLLEIGYTQEDIYKAGLIKKGEKNYYDTFRNRVIFTIFSSRGDPIAFGGRVIDNSSEAKYLNSPETKIFEKRKNLYGYINKGASIRKKGFALLMEGYMDVLTAHSNGFDNAVATLGTSLTEEQAKLLKRVTENVVICYDMDSAGQQATERAGMILKKYEFNVKVLELAEVKDPDEFLRKKGILAFTEQLKRSKEIFEYLYNQYSSGVDFSDVISKKIFVEKFKNFFESIGNKIEFEIYLDKLSANISIPKDELSRLYKKEKIKKRPSRFNYGNRVKKYNKLEFETISLILLNPKYLEEFSDIEIKDEFLRSILEYIRNNAESKNLYNELLNSIEFEENKESVVELIYSLDNIEDEENFFIELKKRWGKKEIEVQDGQLKKEIENPNISEEEKKKLRYERYLLIKKLKEES